MLSPLQDRAFLKLGAALRKRRAARRRDSSGLCSDPVEPLDCIGGKIEVRSSQVFLNVPFGAARLVLAPIVAPFLKVYPDIRLDIVAEDAFVDLVAESCDAGTRYDEQLAQDMIAVPIRPAAAELRLCRFARLS